MMMMPTILNTARDVSDDRHSARTTVARPRPIASRDYRMPICQSVRRSLSRSRIESRLWPSSSWTAFKSSVRTNNDVHTMVHTCRFVSVNYYLSRERKFLGAKVLSTFAPGTESS